jgi:uncharacterized protein
MSLTNYVMQALIVVPFCLAFHLFDHIAPTIALVMTAAIWIFQVLFCSWWLRNFRFGPMEWLLRRFTYGKAVTQRIANDKLEVAAAPVMIDAKQNTEKQ